MDSRELDDDMLLVIVAEEDSSGTRLLQDLTREENIISHNVEINNKGILMPVKEEPVNLLKEIKEEPQDFYQLRHPDESSVNFLQGSETLTASRKKNKKKCKDISEPSISDEYIPSTPPSLSSRRKPKPNPKYNEYMNELSKSSTKISKKMLLQESVNSVDDESGIPSSWFKSSRRNANLNPKRKSPKRDEIFEDSDVSSDKNNAQLLELQKEVILEGLNLKRKSIKKAKECFTDLAQMPDNNNDSTLEMQEKPLQKGLKRKSIKKDEDSTDRSDTSKSKRRKGRKPNSKSKVTEIEKIFIKKEPLDDTAKNSSNNVMDDFFQFQDLRRGFTPKPKSYVAELVKQQPKLAKNEEKLINELCKAMKEVKPPPPPQNYFFMKNSSYVCTKCGHVTVTLPAATRHYNEKHGPRYLICFACGVDFRSTTNLYKHEMRCIASDAPLVLKARARQVGAKGRSRPFLCKKPKKPKEPEKREFPCAVCPAKFASRAWLVAHTNSHYGVRPFVCHECGAAYAASTTLSKHRKKHSDQQFICDHCKRSFKMKSALVTHLDTHLPLPRFLCAECPQRYASRAALRLHERRAHRRLPPPARCALCARRYPRMWCLKKHMLRAHGMQLMTRKMFYKNLPTMTETEVQEATVVVKADLENMATDDEASDEDTSRAPAESAQDQIGVRESSPAEKMDWAAAESPEEHEVDEI